MLALKYVRFQKKYNFITLSYRERRRDRPDEARQPICIQRGKRCTNVMVLIPTMAQVAVVGR